MQYYRKVKTSSNEFPAPGKVIVITKEGRTLDYQYTGSDISKICLRDQYEYWLEEVVDIELIEDDLYKKHNTPTREQEGEGETERLFTLQEMIECWNAAWLSGKGAKAMEKNQYFKDRFNVELIMCK